MAYPFRSNTLPTWDIPPPPGAEEYHQPILPTPPQSAYIPPQTGFYTGVNNANSYNYSSSTYYPVENDNKTQERYSPPIRAPGTSERQFSRRSESTSPPPRHSSRRYFSKRDRSPHSRYSRERERERYESRHSRRSVSRSRHRSRSSSRYHRRRSRSDSRRRYRRSRNRSRERYPSRDRKSRSNSRSRSYVSRKKKRSRSRSSSTTSLSTSGSRSKSKSRSPSKSFKSDSPRSSPSKEDISMIETTSRTSNLSQSSLPHRGLDRQSHKEFIKSKAQEYTNKTQQSMLLDKDASNTFKNDGSFLEMFKKMQEKKEKQSEKEPEQEKPEKILNIVAAASTLLEPHKPPSLPIVSKRRGGRVLKTGVVEKKRLIVQEEQPKDAWAVYMKEVKRYKEACCDDDSKTRPLVK